MVTTLQDLPDEILELVSKSAARGTAIQEPTHEGFECCASRSPLFNFSLVNKRLRAVSLPVLFCCIFVQLEHFDSESKEWRLMNVGQVEGITKSPNANAHLNSLVK
jgi:hypothetical protein